VQTRTIAWLDQPGAVHAVPIPRLPGAATLSASDPRAVAPACGQHTREVLRAAGITPDTLAALTGSGVIREANAS
ncbi:MAG: hypothetical protein AB7S98_22570, partial [Burkholderiaceae bacterium]